MNHHDLTCAAWFTVYRTLSRFLLLPFRGATAPPEPDLNQERATTPSSEPLARMETSTQAALAQAESV